MRHLIRILLFVVILGLLIGAARWIGHQRLPSSWVEVLHLNECEFPCWIGIRAGETTLEDAKTIVKAKYGELGPIPPDESGYEIYAVNTESTDYKFYVKFYNEVDEDGNPSPVITFVAFDFNEVPSNKLSLGDLFWLLDSPDLLNVTQQNFVLLYYQKFHAISAITADPCGNTHRLSYNQRVIGLTMWDESIEEIAETYDKTKWRGFVSGCYE